MLRITVQNPSVQGEEIINWVRRDQKDQFMLLKNISVVPEMAEMNVTSILCFPLPLFKYFKGTNVKQQKIKESCS